MQSRIRDLKCKEVINICDGCRLGYVDDIEVRVPEGQVVAVIVYGAMAILLRIVTAQDLDTLPTIGHRKTKTRRKLAVK